MARVVLADPDSKERDRLRRDLVERCHHDVVGMARDGQEAVHITLQNKPDVVLLSTRLPVLDGYQTAEMISLAAPGTMIMIMTEDDRSDDLRRAMRAGGREVVPRQASPELLASKIDQLLDILQLRQTIEYQNITDISHIPMTITVTGAKGGVGKTTIGVNLAVSLAVENPRNVVLVDLYPQFGDVATMLNLSPRRTMADMTGKVEDLDPHFVDSHLETHESGLRVLIGSVEPRPLDFFSAHFLDVLMGILKRSYRFIVVDAPPVLHSGTIYMLTHSQLVLLIANLQDLTTASDTKKHMTAIRGRYVPENRLKIVLNRVSKDSLLHIEDVEKLLDRHVTACVPNDGRMVSESINVGVPLVTSHPHNPVALGIRELKSVLLQPAANGANAGHPGRWQRFMALFAHSDAAKNHA
jgi:pilus assembly protein CpaE